jgi:hypothetical protein
MIRTGFRSQASRLNSKSAMMPAFFRCKKSALKAENILNYYIVIYVIDIFLGAFCMRK